MERVPISSPSGTIGRWCCRRSRPLHRSVPKPDLRSQAMTSHSSHACYYRNAMHLQMVARELLGDQRANRDLEALQVAGRLLGLVEQMRADSPGCWETAGRCGKCDPGRPNKRHER